MAYLAYQVISHGCDPGMRLVHKIVASFYLLVSAARRSGIRSLAGCLLGAGVLAAEPLPYPEGEPDALQIARQVDAVIRSRLLRNVSSEQAGEEIAMVVTRGPLANRIAESKPSISTFESYSNHPDDNPDLQSMQMAIIRSGRLRGTGILYITYRDPNRSSQFTIWLPQLRKARRFAQPAHEDTWAGTNLTYGELMLRRPEHETHERLEDGVLQNCLPAMQLSPAERNRYTQQLPGPQCVHQGKPVYRLKSASRFSNWWYDYHISEIDKLTFAPYRTEHYKNDKLIKSIAMDWQSLEQADPRISYPRYIYALSHDDGRDTMIHVPRSTVRIDRDDLDDRFWSEQTLRKYGRR